MSNSTLARIGKNGLGVRSDAMARRFGCERVRVLSLSREVKPVVAVLGLGLLVVLVAVLVLVSVSEGTSEGLEL